MGNTRTKGRMIARMIEVLRHGNSTFTATCNICGCSFSYGLDDIEHSMVPHVKCPECGSSAEHRIAKGLDISWGRNGHGGPNESFSGGEEMTQLYGADENNSLGPFTDPLGQKKIIV